MSRLIYSVITFLNRFYSTQKCEPGYFLVVDIANKQWMCQQTGLAPIPKKKENAVEYFLSSVYDVESIGVDTYVIEDRRLTRCPVDGFNVCPSQSGTPAPIPNPDDVDSNPMGICRCNGELWVSEGCSYGFYCDDTQEKGGFLKTCPEVSVFCIFLCQGNHAVILSQRSRGWSYCSCMSL